MRETPERDCEVIIVGAGPVGLFLACCLQNRHISCKVLERRPASQPHSRSIGIHPVSLELFAELGIDEQFLTAGHPIKNGHAYLGRDYIGTIDFSRCPPPFHFILALPQYSTETILENHLQLLDPTILMRGCSVSDCEQDDTGVAVSYEAVNGRKSRLHANFLVGADGINSTIRNALGIAFSGGAYPDRYVMGDFADSARGPRDAAIYLHRDGLVESFPLPAQRRRWVVKTDQPAGNSVVDDMVRLIGDRTGVNLAQRENFMLSPFGVQHYIAKHFVKGRAILVGDAAHIVSPIGGQGMNLGWLDAWALTKILSIGAPDGVSNKQLSRYENRRRKIAGIARRRAEFNMQLGRKARYPWLRRLLIRGLLAPPVNKIMANTFTMRGLTE